MIGADIAQGCNDSFRGGIQEFYIIESCLLTAATASATAHSFTAITSASDWFKVEGEKNSMGWTAEANDNGSVNITVDMRFEGCESVKMHAIQDIINARKVSVVAVTNESAGTNPRAFLLGYDSIQGNQAFLTPKGGAKIEPSIVDGMNDVTLQLTGVALELPREMIGTIDYNVSTVTFGS